VNIEYDNYQLQTGSWSESNITYTYTTQLVDAAEFKAEQLGGDAPGVGEAAARTVLNRHGLRILVRQSGVVGTFDSATLLLTLTGGLGLLFLSTLIVDIVATRLLPLRGVYSAYKIWRSEDMADLALLPPADLRRLAEEDLVNHPPAFLDLPVVQQTRSFRVQRTLGRLGGADAAAAAAASHLPPEAAAATAPLAAASASGGGGGGDAASATLNPLRGLK